MMGHLNIKHHANGWQLSSYLDLYFEQEVLDHPPLQKMEMCLTPVTPWPVQE